MLLRALGVLIIFAGSAAAQSPAERGPRGANRDLRADRSVAARGTAQSPAERASRSLNQDVRADRFRDAARDARGDARPTRPEVQQFEPQRRTLQPDVGRPEQNGRISGTEGTAGGLPSMGPNPQR